MPHLVPGGGEYLGGGAESGGHVDADHVDQQGGAIERTAPELQAKSRHQQLANIRRIYGPEKEALGALATTPERRARWGAAAT
ncbi:hypothetical protein [Nonomuraea sp. NPDC001699]